MAITPSDFSKIWASNADTPEYTFNEADYLKGWDFVGNLPPTRAMWNAMQKRTDEKMKYVFDNFGAPLTASTVAGMTMQNRVYVYTGSETGYTAGHWYYWDGTAWTDGGVYNSNTVQVDPTLTISGAAADAQSVGVAFSDADTRTNDVLNLVNYGYSAGEEHLTRTAGATDTTAFDFRRIGTTIYINNGGIASNAYLRASGTLTRTLNPLTVLHEGITLKKDCLYYICLKALNDDAKTHLRNRDIYASVYKVGTTTSLGNFMWDDDKNRFMSVFSPAEDDELNICLVIIKNTTYDNAAFQLTLERVELQGKNDVADVLDSKINRQHNLINYQYTNQKEVLFRNETVTSGDALNVERVGTRYTLTCNSIGSVLMLRASGNLIRTNSSIVVRGWDTGIYLQEGHRYKLQLRYLNAGAIEKATKVSASVYKVGESASIGTYEWDIGNNVFIRIFDAPATMLNLVIYISAQTELNDAVYDLTLEDITGREDEESNVETYFLEELSNTIDKVNDLKDEPCLTFMWATDIHWLSSNAQGVQTFPKMIQNMKAFSNSVKCDFILNTGDDTDGNATTANTLQHAYEMTKKFLSIGVPYYKSNGNHDNNPYAAGAYRFDIGQVFKSYYTLTPHNVTINTAENGTDFYADYNDIGVRFISVNDNNVRTRGVYAWGPTTPNWLTSALDTDKTVLLSLHISPIPPQVYNNQPVYTSALNSAVLNALNSFVNRGGNLIMLSGHSHADMAFINPFVSIMDVCQRFYIGSESGSAVDDDPGYQAISGYIDVINRPERTAGTYTEDAWTVGVYKPFSNELDLIRFGAGNDRYFHITPIAPTTVTSRLSGTLTWSSSDETVATVADGVITGIGTGKCAVLAKDEVGNYECWIVRC